MTNTRVPLVSALWGAFGFLTRLPIQAGDERDWEAFSRTPATFPIVGFVVGALAALPLLASRTLPAATVALGYVVAVYLLTGIHHLDGVADLGDATAVHGTAERRREVLKDTTTGVGALLAVSIVVAGVTFGGLALAGLSPLVAVGVAVAAEVGAKLGMAAIACLGTASHEGFGSQFTERVGPTALVLPVAVAAPAGLLTWPHGAAAAALLGALAGAILPWLWARRRLGGVSGDIFGAANETGRVVGLHVGVIVWTLW